MQSPPPFKFCPACGQKLAMYMQQCGRCKAVQPPMQAASPTAAPPVTPTPIVPPSTQVKTTLTKQQSKALGNKILAGCGTIIVLSAVMVIAFPPQHHRYPCILHRMDGYAVPAVSVHEHTEDGKAMLVPLQEGTKGTWNSVPFSLEGMTYGSVHVTSGYKAGEDVIVPTECIGNEEEQQEEQRQAEHNRQEDIRVSQEINHMETGTPSQEHPYNERPSTDYPVSPGRASLPASFPTAASMSTSFFQPSAPDSRPSVTYMPAPPPNQTLTPIYPNVPPLPGARQPGQAFGGGGPAGFGARPMGGMQGSGQPPMGQGSFGGGFRGGGGRGF